MESRVSLTGHFEMLRATTVVTSAWLIFAAFTGGVPLAAAGDDLIDAVKQGDLAAVRTVLGQGVDVNTPEADGATALHWAIYRNNLPVVEALVGAGADVTAQNRYGVRPLGLASVNGNGALLEFLLDAGADANTTLAEGETALMTAARGGRVDAVTTLLAHGADVNAVESWRGQTALMWAAAEGHSDVVKVLIDHGADIHATSEKAFTALLFASRQGQIDTVQALLDAGADLEATLDVFPRRTTGGVAIDVPPEPGLNALLLAAGNAHYELATLLLARGADPNASPRGWTVLHQVSWVRKAGVAGSNDPAPTGSGRVGSLDFVRTLVERGADLDARVERRPPAGITALNMVGGTPFLLASRTADADYMRLLVELGADPTVSNEDDATPLMVASGLGTSSPGEDPGTEPEVIEAVLLALGLGGDINHVDHNGETAMHGAAYKHLPSVVRLLADHGADIEIWNRRNTKGWTPLNIAEGVHRGMNILSSPPTADAIRDVMIDAGVEPVFRP